MGYSEWSDDESNSRRDKFRPEREKGSNVDDYDTYNRKKRTRSSPIPPEERRSKRKASFSPPRAHANPRGRNSHEGDSDYYMPNYARDGYSPAPRYGNKPQNSNYHKVSHKNNNQFGYGAMDMMANNWPNMGGFTIDPNQVDYLVPFKQFSEYTRRTVRGRMDDDELQKRYSQYKDSLTSRQLAQFFSTNKDKEWFKEKYHPTVSLSRCQDTKERRQKYLAKFLTEFASGQYDNVGYDKEGQSTGDDTEEPEEALTETSNNDNEEEYEPYLVIKTVPPTISRDRIKEMCSKVDGFDYLALSEPGPNKKFHRIGWIHFTENTDMKKTFQLLDNQKIDDFTFHLAMNRKNTPQTRVPRIAPDITNTTERLQKDYEQAKQLAVALEAVFDQHVDGLEVIEKRSQELIDQHAAEEGESDDKMEDGEEENTNEIWNLKKKLDLIIVYLRHVHMFCYYCGLECDSIEELNRKCCEPHCRKIANKAADEGVDPKQAAKIERGMVQWAKNLDHRISLKIHTPDDQELEKIGGRVAQSQVESYVKEHVLKEHDSKYKCQIGECAKAFKGYDYVEKHILSKHPEDIERIRTEAEYFNNYVCDPNHLLTTSNSTMNTMGPGAPFAQQPPFMMGNPRNMPGMHVPPVAGPWNQMPPMGFGPEGYWNPNAVPSIPNRRPGYPMPVDQSFSKDPRQVKSYVDLDAPAEGDSDISFY